MTKYYDIVFDSPPGPDSSFVEVEDDSGTSVCLGTWKGTWIKRPDGTYALRIPADNVMPGQMGAATPDHEVEEVSGLSSGARIGTFPSAEMAKKAKTTLSGEPPDPSLTDAPAPQPIEP